jgi:hypothetical protein
MNSMSDAPRKPEKKHWGCLATIIVLALMAIIGHFVGGGPDDASVCKTISDGRAAATREVQVSCPVYAGPSGDFLPLGTADRMKTELLQLKKNGVIEGASRIAIWFWADGLVDKYGNRKDHIDVFTVAWSGDELRQVNWDSILSTQVFRLADGAWMASNQVGEEYLAALRKATE